jgi:hypothetical protein
MYVLETKFQEITNVPGNEHSHEQVKSYEHTLHY